MAYPGTRSVNEAVFSVLTEDELVQMRRKEGTKIVQVRNGQYWQPRVRGFYRPPHLLKRLRWDEMTPPWHSWGYQAALHDDDAHHANSTMSAYCIPNAGGYEKGLRSPQTRNLRKSVEAGERVVEVVEPHVLRDHDQGYQVHLAAAQRTGMEPPPPPERYRARLPAYVSGPRLVLAALDREDKLIAYLDGFAVSGKAYVESIYHDTARGSRGAGARLLVEFVKVCERNSAIRQIVHGLHTPDNEGLNRFKRGMNFSVARVPARFRLPPLTGAIMARMWPGQYYRITGDRSRL